MPRAPRRKNLPRSDECEPPLKTVRDDEGDVRRCSSRQRKVVNYGNDSDASEESEDNREENDDDSDASQDSEDSEDDDEPGHQTSVGVGVPPEIQSSGKENMLMSVTSGNAPPPAKVRINTCSLHRIVFEPQR